MGSQLRGVMVEKVAPGEFHGLKASSACGLNQPHLKPYSKGLYSRSPLR